MPAIRRLRWTLLVLAAIVVVAGSVRIIATARGGDADRFASYVRQYATGWSSSDQPGRPQRDQAWIETHPRAVLAAGRRACAWLGDRPDAPDLDPSGRSDASAVGNSYVTTHRDLPLATYTRLSVATGAWEYLCADVRDAKTSPRAEYQDD